MDKRAYDSLKTVYDASVMQRLTQVTQPPEDLLFRINVLQASGPRPSDAETSVNLRKWRAVKAAWEAYLDAAFACGMFDGTDGKDLRARLTGTDANTFRGAMAECMACWFFVGRLGLQVSPRPPGRKGRNLDLGVIVDNLCICVEVKAPHRELTEDVHWGDDSDIIARCLDDAQKQFNAGQHNVLVLVPTLRMRVYDWRNQIIHALFGKEVIALAIDRRTGSAVGEPSSEFVPDGRLLATVRKDGRWLKPNGMPKNTKIGAVLCIEEQLVGMHDGPLHQSWIDHKALVLHNPHATHPIPRGIWRDIPQLVPDKGRMVWTDKHEVVQ